jgi:hypothetical protein
MWGPSTALQPTPATSNCSAAHPPPLQILESSPWLDPHFPHPQSWQPQPVLPLHQSPPQPALVSGSAQAALLGSWTPHTALPCQASRADQLERTAGGTWQGGSAAGAPVRSTAEYDQLSLAEQHRRQVRRESRESVLGFSPGPAELPEMGEEGRKGAPSDKPALT